MPLHAHASTGHAGNNNGNNNSSNNSNGSTSTSTVKVAAKSSVAMKYLRQLEQHQTSKQQLQSLSSPQRDAILRETAATNGDIQQCKNVNSHNKNDCDCEPNDWEEEEESASRVTPSPQSPPLSTTSSSSGTPRTATRRTPLLHRRLGGASNSNNNSKANKINNSNANIHRNPSSSSLVSSPPQGSNRNTSNHRQQPTCTSPSSTAVQGMAFQLQRHCNITNSHDDEDTGDEPPIPLVSPIQSPASLAKTVVRNLPSSTSSSSAPVDLLMSRPCKSDGDADDDSRDRGLPLVPRVVMDHHDIALSQQPHQQQFANGEEDDQYRVDSFFGPNLSFFGDFPDMQDNILLHDSTLFNDSDLAWTMTPPELSESSLTEKKDDDHDEALIETVFATAANNTDSPAFLVDESDSDTLAKIIAETSQRWRSSHDDFVDHQRNHDQVNLYSIIQQQEAEIQSLRQILLSQQPPASTTTAGIQASTHLVPTPLQGPTRATSVGSTLTPTLFPLATTTNGTLAQNQHQNQNHQPWMHAMQASMPFFPVTNAPSNGAAAHALSQSPMMQQMMFLMQQQQQQQQAMPWSQYPPLATYSRKNSHDDSMMLMMMQQQQQQQRHDHLHQGFESAWDDIGTHEKIDHVPIEHIEVVHHDGNGNHHPMMNGGLGMPHSDEMTVLTGWTQLTASCAGPATSTNMNHLDPSAVEEDDEENDSHHHQQQQHAAPLDISSRKQATLKPSAVWTDNSNHDYYQHSPMEAHNTKHVSMDPGPHFATSTVGRPDAESVVHGDAVSSSIQPHLQPPHKVLVRNISTTTAVGRSGSGGSAGNTKTSASTPQVRDMAMQLQAANGKIRSALYTGPVDPDTGSAHGVGTLYFPATGDVYHGQLCAGQMHGKGTYTFGSQRTFGSSKSANEGHHSDRSGTKNSHPSARFASRTTLQGIFRANIFVNGTSTTRPNDNNDVNDYGITDESDPDDANANGPTQSPPPVQHLNASDTAAISTRDIVPTTLETTTSNTKLHHQGAGTGEHDPARRRSTTKTKTASTTPIAAKQSKSRMWTGRRLPPQMQEI